MTNHSLKKISPDEILLIGTDQAVHNFFVWFVTFLFGSRLFCLVHDIYVTRHEAFCKLYTYSTVTLFAKFLGLSTSLPRASDA